MAKCLCEAAKQVLDELENYNIMHIDGISGRGCVRNRDLVQAERNYEKYKRNCKCQPSDVSVIRTNITTSLIKPKSETKEDSDFEEDAYGSPEGDCLDGLLITTGISKTQCDRCKYAAEQLCLGRITPRAREIMNRVTSLCRFCTNRSQSAKCCHCTEQFFYMLSIESSQEKQKKNWMERAF